MTDDEFKVERRLVKPTCTVFTKDRTCLAHGYRYGPEIEVIFLPGRRHTVADARRILDLIEESLKERQ